VNAAIPLGAEAIVGVLGSGAMGSGIAQVAALRGHSVVLADAAPDAVKRAREAHVRALAREVEKARLTRDAADAALGRIIYVAGMGNAEIARFAPCALVVEAIVEDLAAKQALFQAVGDVVHEDAVLATNTSSLLVAAVGAKCARRERVLGIHFFNPVPVMPLVEVIPALTTDPSVTDSACALVESWNKIPVRASDTPGFIVNRIARPFYGESLRLLEEGIADCATIDWAMRELGGFKMGPFELMDFIGNDVNYAVTCSVFEAMYYDSRYLPALTQRRLVEAGLLGRKTKQGYYDYRDGAAAPQATRDESLGQHVLDRVLAMLVNAAVDALYLRVASAPDIELAMTKGVNYPKGLLAWGDEIGTTVLHARLAALQAAYGEDRYRPSPLLTRLAKTGARILD
jgi:3-hydroxybutyryl-CoA dehydrogenase